MLTIVKGTAIAQYVNRDHVATLNGVLGLPLALSRAGAPLMMGLMWTPQVGYTHSLWLLLALSLAGFDAGAATCTDTLTTSSAPTAAVALVRSRRAGRPGL
jgi:hypothetical protein